MIILTNLKKSILLVLVFVFNLGIGPFPDFDPLDKDQAEIPNMSGFGNPSPGFQTGPVSPRAYGTLNPNSSDAFNEPHPFPEDLVKFGLENGYPKYYRQLLKTTPVDNVQSLIFDESEFKKVRKIFIQEFENKTYAPNRDETAGQVIATQMYHELLGSNNYAVTSSPMSDEGYRMKISTDLSSLVPSDKRSQVNQQAPKINKNPSIQEKDADAVMIGAVTKYLDKYVDRRGNTRKSFSGGVEFGSYLINKKSGKVIWGARYVIHQSPGISNLFKHQARWLSKSELARQGMKKVLKAFYENKTNP